MPDNGCILVYFSSGIHRSRYRFDQLRAGCDYHFQIIVTGIDDTRLRGLSWMQGAYNLKIYPWMQLSKRQSSMITILCRNHHLLSYLCEKVSFVVFSFSVLEHVRKFWVWHESWQRLCTIAHDLSAISAFDREQGWLNVFYRTPVTVTFCGVQSRLTNALFMDMKFIIVSEE